MPTSRSCTICRAWCRSSRQAGKDVLEVGCGAGTDLVRFARGSARADGVDLAESAIDLAKANFAQQGLSADLRVADGEALPFADASISSTPTASSSTLPTIGWPWKSGARKPGGLAIFQVYNRRSWLNALSSIMKVGLEHEDAPVLKKYTWGEFEALLQGFREVEIVAERFPVKSRLHAAGRASPSTRSSSAPSTPCRARSSASWGGTCWRSAARDGKR